MMRTYQIRNGELEVGIWHQVFLKCQQTYFMRLFPLNTCRTRQHFGQNGCPILLEPLTHKPTLSQDLPWATLLALSQVLLHGTPRTSMFGTFLNRDSTQQTGLYFTMQWKLESKVWWILLITRNRFVPIKLIRRFGLMDLLPQILQ